MLRDHWFYTALLVSLPVSFWLTWVLPAMVSIPASAITGIAIGYCFQKHSNRRRTANWTKDGF